MIPCFNRNGMIQVIGFSIGTQVIAQFDAGVAASRAKQAADPTYKCNPFADKPTSTPKTAAQAIAAVCERARQSQRP